MDKVTKISKEEIEALSLCLLAFKKAYYFQTRNKLETVDQIIEEIRKGIFTFEDVFMAYIDQCLGVNSEASEEDEIFWEDNMEMFDYQNYFPGKKRISEGAWIKIRTENGFEVHWAKTAVRKRRFDEEMIPLMKKLSSLLNGQIKDSQDMSGKKVEDIFSASKKTKMEELQKNISELHVRMLIELKPYEVVINRTKSVKEYYMPYQYELVENVEQFSDAYVNNITGVDIKRFYTSNNSDAVFYLTSRGISKKTAEMMATLKQTYFTVNMNKAIEEYNRQFKEAVIIVEK